MEQKYEVTEKGQMFMILYEISESCRGLLVISITNLILTLAQILICSK